MAEVVPVHYHPHDDAYRLDIELIPADDLRARVASDPQRGFERIDFQCFIYVAAGTYTHVVDFETYELVDRSCLMIAPGQVHRFGPPCEWTGWMLVVSAPHVSSEARELPTHVCLQPESAGATTELLLRMEADARSSVDRQRLTQLLLLQTSVLVGRLTLGVGALSTNRLVDPTLLSRYREYRGAVDSGHRRWHLVTPYARSLGCSSKSLNRACRAIADVSAKDVIVARIMLEAKRLLALSDDTVSAISHHLGFDEATNFVKFFRRESGMTPTAFRASVQEPDT